MALTSIQQQVYDNLMSGGHTSAAQEHYNNIMGTQQATTTAANNAAANTAATTTQPQPTWQGAVDWWLSNNPTASLTDISKTAEDHGAFYNPHTSSFYFDNQVYNKPISAQQQQQPQQQQPQQTGLTLADLNTWWGQQQAAQNNGVNTSGSTDTNANSLGQLFPRTNWGNYQTSNRGGRYFDATSGKYQGLGNLQAAQPASF